MSAADCPPPGTLTVKAPIEPPRVFTAQELLDMPIAQARKALAAQEVAYLNQARAGEVLDAFNDRTGDEFTDCECTFMDVEAGRFHWFAWFGDQENGGDGEEFVTDLDLKILDEDPE
jgi:hypothetical protein